MFRFTVFIPDEWVWPGTGVGRSLTPFSLHRFPKAKPILRFSTRIYHPYIHTHNG